MLSPSPIPFYASAREDEERVLRRSDSILLSPTPPLCELKRKLRSHSLGRALLVCPIRPQSTVMVRIPLECFFFIIPAYLQSVQVHSVNWLKEVDECLGEGRSLASSIVRIGSGARCDLRGRLTSKLKN
jgi:hypothetical protein